MKTLLTVVLMTALGCADAISASAAIINISPSKDNTLYEYNPADGDRSNGAGLHFFAGNTSEPEIRRGVIAFDITGHIPPGSTITAVTLSMNMSRTIDVTARIVELHKLLADWGEGTSIAPGGEGDGAPATTNDATWRHRFFDTIFWTTEGGDFSATVSATQSVDTTDRTRGAQRRWLLMCNRGWTIQPATLAGWCWETKQLRQRRSVSILERARARLC
jgi:hypothetical protein